MSANISASEWEIMNVVWAKAPLTATEVFGALPAGHGWAPKTVGTFLTRLVGKRVLARKKREKVFVYSARIGREQCLKAEGESFLQRVFRGATGDLVLHFCGRADFSADEIRELEKLLRAKKAGK